MDARFRLVPITATEAITAGDIVSKTGAIIDVVSSADTDIAGVALTAVASGASIIYAGPGDTITVSNTLTAHRTLIAVGDAGDADYEDQLASGSGHVILGYTIDANTIKLQCEDTGNEKA